jgi:hypothetical protein
MAVGFARTYFLRGYFFTTPLPLLLRIHGFAFTSWLAIFAVQSALVAGRRVDLHRSLGIAGAALAAAVFVIGVTTAIVSARHNVAAGGDATLSFLAIPLGDMITFVALVATALYYRRKPEIHKRLMLLATVSILGAAFARWPLAIVAAGHVRFFGATDSLAAAGPLYDLLSRRRVHPAYICGGLFLVASQVVRVYVSGTHAWLAVARALVV